MPWPMRVLVTGVGGDLGQAIVKALSLVEADLCTFGSDTDPGSLGEAFVHEFVHFPVAGDQDYLAQIEEFCRGRKIDAVVPASEAEIIALSRTSTPPRLLCGTAVICQDASWREIYGDKLG